MQASNFTDELQGRRACARRPKTNYICDTSFSSGGPIIRDRLWFLRAWPTTAAARATIPGMFYNKNAATSPSGPTRPTRAARR